MAGLAPLGRFYSKSFSIDPIATARAVLLLRDRLVDGGWSGDPIAGGGHRLDAIAELERVHALPLPAGLPDRVAASARAMEDCGTRLYEELFLVEPAELWPVRWQGLFRELEQKGTRIGRAPLELPSAPANTDLGRAQAALTRVGATGPTELLGDGSFVVLTAETSWQAARAAAAILAGLPADRTVVIREQDHAALDHALVAQGLRAQGRRSIGTSCAALQVLSLALELAFEPKDPYRVLELLTLPVGPFQGSCGHRFARALTQSPGIGGPAWLKAKRELAERFESPDMSERIAEWFERPGAASAGASKPQLLDVVARVRAWILSRISGAPDDPVLLAAAGHTASLRAALEADPRAALDLVEVRRLSETVLGSGIVLELEPEHAGRIDHVDSPAGLLVPRDIVVWWLFAEGDYARSAPPFRRRELEALERAGIHLPDPRAQLAERAMGWRRAILAATQRVIFVKPRSSAGETLAVHPLWDEIVARTGANEAAVARIEVDVSGLLLPPFRGPLLEAQPLERLTSLPLPGGHLEWSLGEGELSVTDALSATSLQELLGCPLRWALHHRAGIRSGGHTLSPPFIVNGNLGHRLIEILHDQGAFALADSELEPRAGSVLDELFVREAAVLLRAGMGIERGQLRVQLVRAVLALSRTLRTSGLRIVAVEKDFELAWGGERKLSGRIDLLLAAPDGEHAIVDIKWGFSSYRDLLQSGQAVQLAAYAYAQAAERGDRALPQAAYFSLEEGRLLSLSSRLWADPEPLPGAGIDETWKQVERTVDNIQHVVAQGRLPVPGLRRSVPLLEALGVPESARDGRLALGPDISCKYCHFDALCGRRWETVE